MLRCRSVLNVFLVVCFIGLRGSALLFGLTWPLKKERIDCCTNHGDTPNSSSGMVLPTRILATEDDQIPPGWLLASYSTQLYIYA